MLGKGIVMFEESLNCELKQEYIEDIKKTVVAFANSDGGDIYIGVKDDGKVCGVKNTDEIMLKLTSSIHDGISPDLTNITNLTVSKIDSKKVIKIHVERGASRPYYLIGKGIRPEGVFIRLGTVLFQQVRMQF
jgi:ATP-dependent DNA helicase RecG